MSEYDDLISDALADAEANEKAVTLDLDDVELKNLNLLTERMMKLEDHIAYLEDLGKKAGESLRQLREQFIPDAMVANNLKLVELGDGSKLSVSIKYIGSITKDNEEAALEWFKKSGRSGVVTPTLTVLTEKGRVDEAETIAKQLTEQGIPCSLKPTVHWQTLRSVVRELYESGEVVPSCISTHVINEAKIKRAK